MICSNDNGITLSTFLFRCLSKVVWTFGLSVTTIKDCISVTNHSQIDDTNNNTSILINCDDEPLISHKNDQTQVDTPLLPIKTTSEISLSSTNGQSSDHPFICRLCHCQGTNDEPLISPCYCLGTMQYLHQSCLQRLIKNTDVKSCELCKCEFIMHAETKPCKQWQKLNMNCVKTCKVVCSVACSLIAGTCVLWCLYVLIEKTEEIKAGKL
ncbi:unnamed protein product, partial [Rotaria sp. Silwood2]